jgi:tetratricopeptide (TPR) repeat protein
LLKALELALNANLPDELVIIYRKLANHALHEVDLTASTQYIEKAHQRAREQKFEIEIPTILMTKANIAHRNGQPREAIALVQQALEMFRSFHEPDSAASATADLGSLYTDLGELDAAKNLLQDALKQAETLEIIEPKVRTLEYLGDLDIAKGRRKSARRHYRKGLQIAKEFKKASLIKDLEEKIKTKRLRFWLV